MTGGQIHDSLRTKIFWAIKLFVQLIFATLFKNKAELFVFPIKPIRSSNMISKKRCNIVERFFLRISSLTLCFKSRVYQPALVGCDIANTGHFYEKGYSLPNIDKIKVAYARMKMFAAQHYPETEITRRVRSAL